MNNKIKCGLAFAIGAAIGSVVTWKIVKNKYEQIAQEEIDSVKEKFSKKQTALTNEVNKARECLKANEESHVHIPYKNLVSDLGYGQPTEPHDNVPRPVKKNEIYVISPDDFGEIGYERETLYYYADKVLAHENDDVVHDVDSLVGWDSLECFGEYEDDSVFVRNEILKTDFEILLDQRTYKSIMTESGSTEEV